MDAKVLRVAAILGVPGFALGVLYLLLRSFGFKFSQINPTLSAAIAIIFLLVVGGLTAFTLHLWRPQRSATSGKGAVKSVSGKSFSAANFVQLGYDLRYVSTLQLFMPENASRAEKELKTLAGVVRLRPHNSQQGNALVSYYFDQIGHPLRKDAFNLGFFLAQIEVGRLLISTPSATSELVVLTKAGMAQAVVDLREMLQVFGAVDLLKGFPAEPTENQIKDLKSSIKDQLRAVAV